MDQTHQNHRYEYVEQGLDDVPKFEYPSPNQNTDHPASVAESSFGMGYQNTDHDNQSSFYPSTGAANDPPPPPLPPLPNYGRHIGPAMEAQNAGQITGGGPQGGTTTTSRASRSKAPMSNATGQMSPDPDSASASPDDADLMALLAASPSILPTASANKTVDRPVHRKMNHSRIDEAGCIPHPDRNWRAPGPYQWVEILRSPELLRYLTNATIKEIQRHLKTLIKMANKKKHDGDPPRLVLVDDGPYDVADANCTWLYCEAYLKRRNQLSNNQAASQSRAKKASTLKHWRALALQAGFPDDDFVCDLRDPANEADAPAALLSAVTRAAIASWRPRQHSASFAPLASLPAPGACARTTNMAPPQSAFPALLADDPATAAFFGQISQLQRPAHPYQQQQSYRSPRAHSPALIASIELRNLRQQPQSAAPEHRRSAPSGEVPLPPQTRAQTRSNARRSIKRSSSPVPPAPKPSFAVAGPRGLSGASNMQGQHYDNDAASADASNILALQQHNYQYDHLPSGVLNPGAEQYSMAPVPVTTPAPHRQNANENENFDQSWFSGWDTQSQEDLCMSNELFAEMSGENVSGWSDGTGPDESKDDFNM